MENLEKLPPQALDMEVNVLGAMMVDPALATIASRTLKEEDFYRGAHRTIFHVSRNLLNNVGVLDHSLLANQLRREGKLEEVGGTDYIFKIISESVIGNIESHIAAIKECSLKRKIIIEGTDLIRTAFDGVPASELLKRLSLITSKLASDATGRIALPARSESALPAEFASEATAKELRVSWPNVEWATKLLRPKSVTVLGGPAGWGKSLWALNLAMDVHLSCNWATLPLEGCKADIERRALAYMARQWWVLDKGPDRAAERQQLWEKYQEDLAIFCEGICENPLLIKTAIDWLEVVDWVERALEKHRGVTIDNLSFISFPDKAQWSTESRFVNRLVRTAERTGGNILLLAHTTKGAGKGKGNELSGENLQGSAMFKRMVDNVLILEKHDRKESLVASGQVQKTVSHERTLIVDKSRHTQGGVRIAMELIDARFEDLGVIVPSAKRRKSNVQDSRYSD